MSYLLDTNILLRSSEPSHPMFAIATTATSFLLKQGEELYIAPQNLIEIWNVCTRPKDKNGLGYSIAETKAEVEKLKVMFPLLPDTIAVFLLLAKLQATLQVSQNIEESDRELAMELSPLVLQWEEEALRRGRIIERRANIENLLRFRFALIDEQLLGIIEPLLELPPEEFTLLLLQLSREELLTRFGR